MKNLMIVLFAIFLSISFASAEPLNLKDYEVYENEFTGDVFLKGMPDKFIIIGIEIVIPIMLPTKMPNILLKPNQSGSYTLSYPGSTFTTDASWTKQSHLLYSGDFNGDGKDDIFLQAKQLTGKHILVYASKLGATADETYLLSKEQVGFAIAANSNVSLRVADFNNDGRADLLVTKEGLLDRLVQVAANGDFSSSIESNIDVNNGAIRTVPTTHDLIANLSGSVSVSPTGAGSYSLPLTIPPGVNGLKPNLSVVYSSRIGNGLLGQGWSISGVSSIHRCAKTYTQDGAPSNVVFNDTDVLCLGGNRLVLVSEGSYWANNAEYRTELDSFSKISLTKTTQAASVSTTWSFEVKGKDGRIYTYDKAIKTAENSQGKPLGWLLSKVKDRFNNEISTTYKDNGKGQTVVDKMTYGQASINFEYADAARTDTVKRYMAGGSVLDTYYLNKITVSLNDKKIKAYDFDYGSTDQIKYNAITGLLQLKNINECGYNLAGTSEQCLLATTVRWTSQESGFASTALTSSGKLTDPISSMAVDWNSDGVQDILSSTKDEIAVYLSDGTGKLTKESLVANTDELTYFSAPIAADFDHNGQSDLLYLNTKRTDKLSYDISRQWHLIGTTSNNIGSGWTVNSGTAGVNPWVSTSPVLLDVEGDGKVDIILPENDNWNIYKNTSTTGNVSFQLQHALTGYSVSDYPKIQALDLDGDGRSELLLAKDDHYHVLNLSRAYVLGADTSLLAGDTSLSANKAIFLDVNGDGLVDIASPKGGSASQNIWLYINKGGSFVSSDTGINGEQIFKNIINNNVRKTSFVKVADINGDGRSDLVYPVVGGNFEALLSKGDTFNSTATSLNVASNVALITDQEKAILEEPKYKEIVTNVTSDIERRTKNFIKSHYSESEIKSMDAVASVDFGGRDIVGESLTPYLDTLLESLTYDQVKSLDSYFPPSIKVKIMGLTDRYRLSPYDVIAPASEEKAKFELFFAIFKITYQLTATPELWTEQQIYFVTHLGEIFDDMVLKISDYQLYDYTYIYTTTDRVQDGYKDTYTNIPYTRGANDFVLADVNGDGRLDIVQRDSGDTQWETNLNQLQPAYVDRFTDNFGNYTQLTYKPLTSSDVGYVKSTGASFPILDVRMPIRVVTQTQSTDGIGGLNAIDYAYHRARLHVQGRGFLGFERTINTAHRTAGIPAVSMDLVTQTTYRQDFPFIGRVSTTLSSKVVGSNTTILAESAVHWQQRPLNGSKSIYTYVADSASQNFEASDGLATSASVVVNTWDDYGNLTKKTQATGKSVTGFSTKLAESSAFAIIDVSNAEKTVTQDQWFYTDPASWLISFKNKETLIYSASGSTNRTINNTFKPYPSTLSLLSSTAFDGDADLWLKTTYTRNLATGNITSISTSGAKITTRAESISNYLFDLYPQTFTNALGQVSKKTYDPRFGAVTSVTDVNNHTTTSSYDKFGSLLTQRYADGSTKEFYPQYCTTACPTTARYQLYERLSHNAVPALGSPDKVTYFDGSGRTVRASVYGYNGSWVKADTFYNQYGQVSSQSLPYTGSTAAGHDTFIYDELGRLLKETKANGTVAIHSFSGNATYSRAESTTLSITGGSIDSETTTSYLNTVGQVKKVIDSKNINTLYNYNSLGKLKNATVNSDSKTMVRYSYDDAGNQLSLSDPDKGNWTNEYDALGLLVGVTDAKNQITTIGYDVLNRLHTRTSSDEDSTWTYDDAPNGVGLLSSITGTGFSKDYTYDSQSRSASDTTTVDNKTFGFSYNYDDYSRLASTTYPSSFKVENVYGETGYFIANRNPADHSILLTQKQQDNFGNATEFMYGNGLITTRAYYPTSGFVASISTSSDVQNLSYEFDSIGNLRKRISGYTQAAVAHNFVESFEYDALNRLRSATTTGLASGNRLLEYNYSNLGNIENKTGVADIYHYDPVRIHAVKSTALANVTTAYDYDLNGNMTTSGPRTIYYTSFNKPRLIQKGDVSVTFKYGPERSRYYQYSTTNAVDFTETYYMGGGHYEEINDNGLIIQKSYVGDYLVQSLSSVTGSSEKVETLNYLHRDHLGSVDAVTDQTGNLLTRMSFDPFGVRRGSNWVTEQVSIDSLLSSDALLTSRGFTDHEELDSVGLIHMNGRVYDPVIGRFLSADILIQSPYNSQSYNRYSYVMNNPLSFTDPSGYVCFGFGSNDDCFGYPYDIPGFESFKNYLTETNNSFPTDTEMYGVRDRNGLFYTQEPTADASLLAGFYNGFARGAVESLIGLNDQDLSGVAFEAAMFLPVGKAFDKVTKKVNLGSGNNPMSDAVNVDIRNVPGVNVVADGNKLPFSSGSFSEAHAVNPFGFNPVSAETARILQPGAVLKVSGTARNKFAQPLSSADAAAAGFKKVGTGPLDSAHQFGIQRATTGGALNTSTSTTTTYIRQ